MTDRVEERVRAEVERLVALDRETGEDEFVANFGSWSRPPHLRRYDLEALVARVRLDEVDSGTAVVDVAPLVRALAPEDRFLAAEILRWVFESGGYKGRRATDRMLRDFRLDAARRLEQVGF